MILQTDYTRRIWTGLTTDDWGEANLQEGDVIYLMDASECWVGGEGMMYQLPDLGGGGGGSEAHPYIQTFDYVQATAWTTDANGNVKNFIDTYCNNGTGIYWVGVHQTSSDTYKAVRGFVIRPSGGSVPASNAIQMLRGTSSWSSTYGTASSFHIVAGAAIRIWYIPLSTTLEDMTT